MQDTKNWFETKILPWSPEELPVFLIEKSQPDRFTNDIIVRRHAVEQWLHWLKENSPLQGYRDIVIDRERLQKLPEDGPLIGLRSIDEEPESFTMFRDFEVKTEEDQFNDNDGNPASDSGCLIPPSKMPSEKEKMQKTVENLVESMLFNPF